MLVGREMGLRLATLEGRTRRVGVWKARESSFLEICSLSPREEGLRGTIQLCAGKTDRETPNLSPWRARRGRDSIALEERVRRGRHLDVGSIVIKMEIVVLMRRSSRFQSKNRKSTATEKKRKERRQRKQRV